MCDLEEGDWPEYVLYVERARARAKERERPVTEESFLSDVPVAASA